MEKKSVQQRSTPASTIKKILTADHLPSSILILAHDRVRRERAIDAIIEKFIKDQCLSPDEAKSALTRIDSALVNSSSLTALKDEVASLSLFSSSRIFIFKEIEKLTSQVTDEIILLSKKLIEKTIIILSGSTLPTTSKLVKTFSSLEQAIILAKPSSKDCLQWATKEARALGLNCDQSLISSLIAISESEALISEQPIIDIINGKLNRLLLYLDGKPAKLSDLEFLFPESAIASEFDFVDEVVLGNIAKSEPLLSTLFQNGKNSFLLLSLFSRSLTNILLVRFLIERGKTQEEIRADLGINPWVLGKVLRIAKAVPASKLLKATHEIVKLDNRLKGASLDEIHLFSSMIGELHRAD